MSIFERYLTLWVVLCIVVGVALGHALPGVFSAVAGAEVAKVNLPVAVLIWLMIVPMLLKIDFGALGKITEHARGVGVTLFINWAVKPFSMAVLGTFFLAHVFAPLLPGDQIPSYIAGLILLAAAPCTAMVFVWSNLVGGDPNYTLGQVALNDVLMIFLFAPIVGLLLGVASVSVPWATLLLSVALYIIVPVIVAQLWRRALLASGQVAFDRTMARLQPIQVYFNAGLAYVLSRYLGVAWCVAAPAALIGASNFFELAVAAAISLFGLNSGAALATVVGVLVEVPVMLTVVKIVTASKGWYEAGVEPADGGKVELRR
ncbi:MAG: bile acid:sodium symporter [Hyphomicrobiales bacterium]|nr:bile acid:sodium symporter [Hyphomicrobiales bacterium]